MCHIPCSTWGRITTSSTHSPHTPNRTHQALEPVAHYTRLNNYFNKQQSSSPSWTVLERRAHNTIFQISIKSKCWESSAPPATSPILQPSSTFSLFSLSLSLLLQPFDCQLQRCVSTHGTTVRWLRGTLLIFYVLYLTFDFLEIYINILFYGIQLVRKGTQVHGPLMKCAAKDCAVLAALGKSLLAQARLDKVVDSSIRENRFKLKTSLCFTF